MRHPVLALIAVWPPTKPTENYGASLPGFPGTNSGGDSLDDCVVNIQEAFDMMTEDIPVTQEHLEKLSNPFPTFDQEDVEIYSSCWYRLIVLDAYIAEGTEFTDEYIARLSIYTATA